MSKDFLSEIVAYKKSLLAEKKAFYKSLKDKIKDQKFSRYAIFREAISKPNRVNLIAEIKKASPSRGVICRDFDVKRIAETYVKSGAAAISVLTEDKFFLGKPAYIRTVAEHFSVPVLAKDFIIDEAQIYEAFSFGASAILLIVAILNDRELKHLLETARRLDMDALVEVHDEKELSRALSAGAEMIGINHRDLHTFTVDLKVSERLIPKIPKGTVIVAESGIKSHHEVQKLRDLGAHAVLIGETFLQAPDIEAKVKEVMGGSGAG